MNTVPGETILEQVRRKYAAAATNVSEGRDHGCGCGEGGCCTGTHDEDFGEALYSAKQRGELISSKLMAPNPGAMI